MRLFQYLICKHSKNAEAQRISDEFIEPTQTKIENVRKRQEEIGRLRKQERDGVAELCRLPRKERCDAPGQDADEYRTRLGADIAGL